VKVLFDQNVPRNLADYLTAHQVTRSIELGWETLKNGDLLNVAQELGFEVLVTCDRNLAYQQNLRNRKLAIVVLPAGTWPQLTGSIAEIVREIGESQPGGFKELKREDPAGD
jgi:predicted nuclease of predicted toxin-antitoxin system